MSLILQQSTTYPADCRESQKRAKSIARSAKRQHETAHANDVFNKLPGSQQSCACGGFPSIRHNELRDLTAQFHTPKHAIVLD